MTGDTPPLDLGASHEAAIAMLDEWRIAENYARALREKVDHQRLRQIADPNTQSLAHVARETANGLRQTILNIMGVE